MAMRKEYTASSLILFLLPLNRNSVTHLHSSLCINQLFIQFRVPKDAGFPTTPVSQSQDQVALTHLREFRQHSPHIGDYPSNLGPVHIFTVRFVMACFPQVPPDSCSQHRISLDKALVVSSEDTAPLNKKILEEFIPDGTTGQSVEDIHAFFGIMREMIDQMAGICLKAFM